MFRKYNYILIIVALILSSCGNMEKKKVYFKDVSFIVEIAETKQQQSIGLMFRKHLPARSGMLFVYEDEAVRSFCTKNMKIALDIIWLDNNKQIVSIEKNTKPANGEYYETFSPGEKARYVLELNSGTADKVGLKIGDSLEF